MKKLIAHRGLKKKKEEENTIESFQSALENPQFVGFECDIRTTKDKVFVIHHNPMKKEDIISFTNYQDLKAKYNIPSLEEVLNLKSNKIFLLEIKEMNLDIDKFHSLLNKQKSKNIYVMSFYNSVIKKLAQKDRNYKLGVLNYVINSEESYEDYDFICLLESIVTEKLIKYFETKGIETFIYGIYHLEEMIEKYPTSYFITDELGI